MGSKAAQTTRVFRRTSVKSSGRLAGIVQDLLRLNVDPDSLFDIQVKRIYAYKRQLLNVMHIIDDYLSLVEDGRQPSAPRTYIFSGKAAPGYWLARQVIKLIHNVGKAINNDPRCPRVDQGRLHSGLSRLAGGENRPRDRSQRADIHRRN